ncbi:TetR-like C-terminal domain-containing protein [Leuconostoc mesenteroides]|uniref:TetR-like C-terminal domain-containing protein n=1 Tax=Leuconostoc mesenteroides TaxID=1245 RepID=UPI001CBFED59|nr:TetR-like C-terminal domain-containing protein [Leuconostoc mesenteroides]
MHESYGKETANELFSILENDKQTDSVEVLLQAIFELVKKNNKVFNFILTEDQDFLANILSTTKQKFFNQLVPDDDTLSMSEKQFLYEYTLNGVVGMIRHWIKSDMKESPKTLTSYFNKWCYQS